MAVVGSRARSSFCSAWIRPVGILPPAGDQCDTAAVDSGHGAARIYVTADIYSELNWTVTSHQYQHSLCPACWGHASNLGLLLVPFGYHQ